MRGEYAGAREQPRAGQAPGERAPVHYALECSIVASWHPLIVHAPLVFIPLAVALAAVAFVRPNSTLRLVAAAVLSLGVVGAFLATQTGGAARRRAGHAAGAITIVGVHAGAAASPLSLRPHAEQR